MARDNSMMTSPWSNSGQFFKDALDRAMPGDSGPKAQKTQEPTLSAVALKAQEESALIDRAPSGLPMDDTKKAMFNELLTMMLDHAELESVDYKRGIALFETKEKQKLRLEML